METKSRVTKPKLGTTKPKHKKKKETVSQYKKPDTWSTDAWQYSLRKQYGEESKLQLTNLTEEPVFSMFEVQNTVTNNTYIVHIRTGVTTFDKFRPNTLMLRNNSCNCMDFRTNRLGICKHIAGAVSVISKKKGVKTLLKKPQRSTRTSLYIDYLYGRRLRICIGTLQESKFLKFIPSYFDENGFLLSDQLQNFEQILSEARAISSKFHCEPDALDLVFEQRDKKQVYKRMSLLLGNKPEKAIEKVLKVKPYQYQLDGIAFAASQGRVLLADEMGLGKTIQAIGVAELYRKHLALNKVLVICPTSLKFQWRTEIEKFCRSSVEIIEGMANTRKLRYVSADAFFHIVSYNAVVFDAEQIKQAGYDMVIYDEAQRMKNFRTKIAAAVRKIETPYALVLTGTPIENKLEELYSLVQMIDQYKLPPLYKFVERYQMQNEVGKVVGFQNLKEIGLSLSECMIRRTKKEVLTQMPDRIDKILYVPMTMQQKALHDESGNEVAMLVAKWRRQHFLTEVDRRKLMIHLGIMRMACDSTFLLDQKTRNDTKITELFCILEEALCNLEQKVVIFSQWERMTRLVAEEAESRSIGFVNFNGNVPGNQRGALIERFHQDPECRLFISTDAGGVGLNLQCANLLFNLDLPWNPGILEQRIGRIYRLGQRNNVNIINMVSEGTIESRMLHVLDFKKDMAKGVLDPEGEDTIFMSEDRLKKFMQNIEAMTDQITGNTVPSLQEAMQLPDQNILAEEDLEAATEASNPTPIKAEADKFSKPQKNKGNGQPLAPYFGDDDLPNAGSSLPEIPSRPIPEPEAGAHASTLAKQPQELVAQGISFLNGLSETLASTEKTQALVQSITETDTVTGQTYLKIPIENQAAVQNTIQLLGNLFAGFMK